MTTKKEALEYFRNEIKPAVVDQYGKGDKVAMREAWNNYTDMLCKDGQITLKKYESWTNPF